MDDKGFIELLTKIHDQKGVDFTQYKEPTLKRRISSRLSSCEVSTFAEYAKYLDAHPEEYNELMDALTINVTEFFRNDESFKAIEEKVISEIFKFKTNQMHRLIRCWSCGFSVGNEPYSLAIILRSAQNGGGKPFHTTIYATDVDPKAIATAKQCLYDKKSIEGVPAKILKEDFIEASPGKYTLRPEIKKDDRLCKAGCY